MSKRARRSKHRSSSSKRTSRRSKRRGSYRKVRSSRTSARKSSARRSSYGRKGMRKARKSQNRRGLRMSTKGFRKAKRRGKTSARRSTFMKLRRKARNPQSARHLKDGSTVTLSESGSDGIVRVIDRNGEIIHDDRLPWAKAVSRFRKHKAAKRYGSRTDRDAYAMIAADNPRRGRKGRKSKRGRGRARRNPAQFPMPFASAMNPRISSRDAVALKRVLRKHGHACRR